jgi:hypothetical protein
MTASIEEVGIEADGPARAGPSHGKRYSMTT